MAGIKKQDISFKKGNRNGISSMYKIRCDPTCSRSRRDTV